MAKMKILAAMSGGVDSSVAAALLKQEGHEILGVTLKLYSSAGKAGLKSCCGFGPEQDAKRVADVLGFPHLVLNAEKFFKETVVDDFVAEYAAGRTPNPCIRCNTFLKFDFLLKQAKALGCEYVATGHYANIQDGRLIKAADPLKDQSYFLYTLNPSNIRKILFPVGEITKSETRRIAKSLGLPVHDKKESQDICFVPNGEYREFLENHGVKGVKGFMFNAQGKMVGEHEGLFRYTIGQRKGLAPQGKRAYVIGIDMEGNRLIIGDKEELLSHGVELDHVSFCADSVCVGEVYDIRLRYRSPANPGKVVYLNGSQMRVCFKEPQEAVAPGQSAVLYRGNEVVGGGTIIRKLSEQEANHDD